LTVLGLEPRPLRHLSHLPVAVQTVYRRKVFRTEKHGVCVQRTFPTILVIFETGRLKLANLCIISSNRPILTEIANRWLENASQFRYLETTVTNQNLIQEEIKKGWNSGNAYYHSAQNLLPSRLLSKTVKN
jgi:hypothetical protein